VTVAALGTVLRSVGGVFNEHRNAVLDADLPDNFTQSCRYAMDFAIGFDRVVNICEPVQILNGKASVVLLGDVEDLVSDLVNASLGEVRLVVLEFLDSTIRLEFRPAVLKHSLARGDIAPEIERAQNLLLGWTVNDDGGKIGRADVNRNNVLEFTRLVDGNGLGEHDLENERLVAPEHQDGVAVPPVGSVVQVSFVSTVLFKRDGGSTLNHSCDGNDGVAVLGRAEPHGAVVVSDRNAIATVLFPAGEHFASGFFEQLGWETCIFAHTIVGLVM
jgi:hypothetical protein